MVNGHKNPKESSCTDERKRAKPVHCRAAQVDDGVSKASDRPDAVQIEAGGVDFTPTVGRQQREITGIGRSKNERVKGPAFPNHCLREKRGYAFRTRGIRNKPAELNEG